MKGIHKVQEHLATFPSDGVALLLERCLTGAFSDLLSSRNRDKTRRRRFIAEVQERLLDTPQR